MVGDIKHFMDRIIAIEPGMHDFLGGGRGGDSGGQDISGQLVFGLREAAIRFAKAYTGRSVDFQELQRLAAQTEGRLLMVATVLRFAPAHTDELVDELHILVAAKAGQSAA